MRGIPDYYINYPAEFVERMKREDPSSRQLAHALTQGLFLGFWFKSRLSFPLSDPPQSDEQRRRIELFYEYKRITSKPIDPIYIRPKQKGGKKNETQSSRHAQSPRKIA